MERWHAKVATLFMSFIIPFVCTLLPLKLYDYFAKKGRTGEIILSCLMCFGGGVFFGTFMLHMAPECREILNVALLKKYGILYPVADLIMALGFFLVLMVENIVLDCNKRRKNRAGMDVAVKCINKKEACGNGADAGDIHHREVKPLRDIEDLTIGEGDCPLYMSGDCCKDPPEVQPLPFHNSHAETLTMIFPNDRLTHDDHGHSHEAMLLKDAHSRRAIVLLIALSFHRIFEGMSIGLQHSMQNVWNLFIAVMCHETVIGFSLGLQFVKNGWKTRRTVIATFFCSLIMPVGVLVGTLMVEIGETSAAIDIANGVLQSLATGTFIYVTFFEILGEEISSHDTTKLKLLSVFFGFAVMAGLSAIPEDANTLLGHEKGNATCLS